MFGFWDFFAYFPTYLSTYFESDKNIFRLQLFWS